MSAIPFAAASRSGRSFPWLLAGGYTVATLDMLVAITYWSRSGVPATRVLQSTAAWLLGPQAYTGGEVTALLGALVYGHVMWGVVALYRTLARRYPTMFRLPLVWGALYGAVAYVAIFQIMAPLLTGVRPDLGDTPWMLTCVVTFMTLVGMPCALFARAAANAEQAKARPR